MGWVGPNGRVYQSKRWVVFAAIGAAVVAVAGWVKGRMKRQTDEVPAEGIAPLTQDGSTIDPRVQGLDDKIKPDIV